MACIGKQEPVWQTCNFAGPEVEPCQGNTAGSKDSDVSAYAQNQDEAQSPHVL
ncbi:hypothetical protein GCM10007867_13250 [Gluconobacter cerinus]|uniref:Uncharacterized protein n=1 Tax=Gluconobacter cerinus TaxID=38307 RepID=A0AAV5NEB1_9PROT|nr:hypothetical protein GCM10007867_13250 [Gluconobacter cerinus]